MRDRLTRWLRAARQAIRRRRAPRADTFAATDRRIAAAERELREINARLDLLDVQADMRRNR